MSSPATPQPSSSLDLLKAMSGQQPQATTSESSSTMDSLSRMAKGDSGEPPAAPSDQSLPPEVEIQPQDRGAGASVNRNLKGLLEAPGGVYHAFADEPKDDTEKAAADLIHKAGHGLITPEQAMGLYRLVLSPMIKERENALAYEKIARDQGDMTGEEATWQRYEANPTKAAIDDAKTQLKGMVSPLSLISPGLASNYSGPRVSDAQHMANMHHIASMIPLLGPQGAAIVEHFMQGDPSGSVTDLLMNAGIGAATHSAGKSITKLAPRSVKIADVEVPITARQAGQPGAGTAEAATRLAGYSGERQLTNFANRQAGAVDESLGSMARSSAEKTAQDLGKPALQMSAEDVAKITDSRNVLQYTDNFDQAAREIKGAVNEQFKVLDEATDGQLGKLRDQRAALRKMRGNPNADPENVSPEFKGKSVEDAMDRVQENEDELFKMYGIGDGKTALDGTRRALAKAYALEDLDDVVHRATKQTFQGMDKPLKGKIQGPSLLKGLDTLETKHPGRIELALGDPEHVANIRKLAGLLQDSQNVAQLNKVFKIIQVGKLWPSFAAGHLPGVATSEAASLIMGKVLTHPRAAAALSAALAHPLGMQNIPAIAGAITQAIAPTEQQ